MSEVETHKYKTDIDTSKSINAARKILDTEESVDYWYIDITNPSYLLTIMGKGVEAAIEKLRNAGFKVVPAV